MTGYTDNVVRIVPAVEGRFHRWGKWAEFDQWLNTSRRRRNRLGRSAAVQSMGIGETINVPGRRPQLVDHVAERHGTLTLPAGFTADATSKPYGPLAAGADTTVKFALTNTDTTLPGAATNDPGNTTLQKTIGIATSFSSPATSEREPDDVGRAGDDDPDRRHGAGDGRPRGRGVYTGPALDLSRKWSGGACSPPGVDCGTSGAVGDATSSYAKVAVNGDNLYFFVHIRDEFQSYAVTPTECVAHWLADSVEILIDPRGNSSATNFDTGTTFKLGVFPFTNDPSNSNGNGVNGPCWERDADNHQGYSTGPLAATVDAAPNAPGVQVVSTATWVGTNDTGTSTTATAQPAATTSRSRSRSPTCRRRSARRRRRRPAARRRTRSTRSTWRSTSRRTTRTTRPRGHDDAAAHRPEHAARLVERHRRRPGGSVPLGPRVPPGLHAAGGPPDDADDAERLAPEPRRRQLAADDLPVGAGRRADLGPQAGAGRTTASRCRTRRSRPARRRSTSRRPGPAPPASSSGPVTTGRSRCTSRRCAVPDRPGADPGLRAQLVRDDRRRHPAVVARHERPRDPADGRAGRRRGVTHVSIPLDAAAYAALAAKGSAIVSFETPNDEVQAFAIGLAQATVNLTQSSSISFQVDPVTFTATVTGTTPFPGPPTGKVQFTVDGNPLGAPVTLDASGVATLTTTALPGGTHLVRAVYLGDADYGTSTSAPVSHQRINYTSPC